MQNRRHLCVSCSAGTYRELLISECEPPRRRRRAPAIARSQSTWSVSSDEEPLGEVAVPGVGVLFSRSPPVGYLDRRHAGYSSQAAAAANPFSPLRRLQNGGDAHPPPPPPPPLPPPPPPPPPPGSKAVNGRAPQLAAEWKRKESMKSRSGRAKEERRRLKKKLQPA